MSDETFAARKMNDEKQQDNKFDWIEQDSIFMMFLFQCNLPTLPQRNETRNCCNQARPQTLMKYAKRLF